MLLLLHPSLLWILGAVAVPIILHLWRHRHPKELIFPTFRFLKKAEQQTRRFRRLTDLLLLCLRILLIALLVLALAAPHLLLNHTRLPQKGRTLVIVLDSSASMDSRLGLTPKESRFEKAKLQALDLLNTCSSSDKVALLFPGNSQATPIFPPRPFSSKISDILTKAQCGKETGSIPWHLKQWNLQSSPQLQWAEIHIFSDFQQESWDENPSPALPLLSEHKGLICCYPQPLGDFKGSLLDAALFPLGTSSQKQQSLQEKEFLLVHPTNPHRLLFPEKAIQASLPLFPKEYPALSVTTRKMTLANFLALNPYERAQIQGVVFSDIQKFTPETEKAIQQLIDQGTSLLFMNCQLSPNTLALSITSHPQSLSSPQEISLLPVLSHSTLSPSLLAILREFPLPWLFHLKNYSYLENQNNPHLSSLLQNQNQKSLALYGKKQKAPILILGFSPAREDGDFAISPLFPLLTEQFVREALHQGESLLSPLAPPVQEYSHSVYSEKQLQALHQHQLHFPRSQEELQTLRRQNPALISLSPYLYFLALLLSIVEVVYATISSRSQEKDTLHSWEGKA